MSDHIEPDKKLPGFGLRTRNGKRTWIYQYKFNGKSRRLKIGDGDMPREQARRLAEAEKGKLAKAKLGHGVDSRFNIAKGLYDPGEYLLTNEKEFFAVTASVFLYGEDGKLTREEIKKSSRTTTNILSGYSDLIQRVLRRRLPWQRWTDTVSILEAGRGPRCAEILAVIEPP